MGDYFFMPYCKENKEWIKITPIFTIKMPKNDYFCDSVRHCPKININHYYTTKYTSFYLFLSIGKVRYYFYKKQLCIKNSSEFPRG